MNKFRFRPHIVPFIVLLVICVSAVMSVPVIDAAPIHLVEPLCPPAPAGTMRSFGWVEAVSSDTPMGLDPDTIKSVYNFYKKNKAGAGKTIAIVDAFDAPNAESDLNVFSAQFNLPPCTKANGCFRKVNESGGKSYPEHDTGWEREISLDIQWAHAIAPGAKILLVEATNARLAHFLIAEDYARKHAPYVSNSWGGGEFPDEANNDSHFIQPGVSFFFSSGDSGTPAMYPSSSPNVISVGGTELKRIGEPKFAEVGWSGSGGGCSTYETAHPAQRTGSVGCNGKRATPDVSLDAAPASGVSVYYAGT